jgi:hypothetical protein
MLIALASFAEPHGHEKALCRLRVNSECIDVPWSAYKGRRLDEGANRGESLAGKSIKVLNFVRLRHLLAAHLAYCHTARQLAAKPHTKSHPRQKISKRGNNQ